MDKVTHYLNRLDVGVRLAAQSLVRALESSRLTADPIGRQEGVRLQRVLAKDIGAIEGSVFVSGVLEYLRPPGIWTNGEPQLVTILGRRILACQHHWPTAGWCVGLTGSRRRWGG